VARLVARPAEEEDVAVGVFDFETAEAVGVVGEFAGELYPAARKKSMPRPTERFSYHATASSMSAWANGRTTSWITA
jgi:hypothetical protein